MLLSEIGKNQIITSKLLSEFCQQNQQTKNYEVLDKFVTMLKTVDAPILLSLQAVVNNEISERLVKN